VRATRRSPRVDKLTYSGNLENLAAVAAHRRCRFVQGDICDTRLVDEIMRGHDIIAAFVASAIDWYHANRSWWEPLRARAAS
jgi:dTDP-D-glucose 4,6-dehydratase